MALSGSLSEFSALETLQLIHIQKKSGSLLITSGKKRVALHFREGALIGCQAASRHDSDPFLAALQGLGQIGADDERRMRLMHAEAGVDPWTRIFETSTLDPATLEQTREMAVQGMIDRILVWNRGHFEFVTGPLPATSGEGWSVERLLLESMRRLDEAADLERGDFPLDSIPVRLSPNAAPAAADNGEDRISAALERVFLAKADGKRTLRDLVAQLQISEYDVLAAARELRLRRLIRVELKRSHSKDGRGDAAQILLEQPFHFRHPVFALAFVALALGVCFVGLSVHGATARVSGRWIAEHREVEAAAASEHAVRLALEMYRVRHDAAPASLDALILDGLWPEDAEQVLADFLYVPGSDGYQLTRGADGAGTEDRSSKSASTADATSSKQSASGR
mgnify:CR=1 FL=1